MRDVGQPPFSDRGGLDRPRGRGSHQISVRYAILTPKCAFLVVTSVHEVDVLRQAPIPAGRAVDIRWMKPPSLVGDERLIRVGPGTGGDEAYSCPSAVAAKARPALRPAVRSRLPHPGLEDFTLGPFTHALDQIEFEEVPVEFALAGLRGSSPPVHPGHLRFVDHAVRLYLESRAVDRLLPVRPYWVVQREDGKFWELYAWWRRYESSDGSVREYRRFRHGSVKGSSQGEVGIAAYVAAHGRPAAWPKPWGERFTMLGGSEHRVQHVRIVEIGLADGQETVQFEGSVRDAEHYYREHGHGHVAKVVSSGGMFTGGSCFDCKQMTACAALPRVPGILGLSSQQAALRKVSISDLRYYRDCPAQAHLRSLHLPSEGEYSDSAKLGQAVHHWIETLHGRDRHPPCSVADMPRAGENWTHGRWRVPDDLAQIGVRMLHHHIDACPFQAEEVVERVEVEAKRAFHDTAAQVVVVAKPDMLYVEDGSWVWRELKTTQKERWFHDDLLEEFPQLALGVVVLARGALGGDPDGSRVEVEILRPEGSDLQIIDPREPERLEKALAVLRRYAEPWREDETFAARPSGKCQWCPVSKWCASYTATAV